MNPLHNRSKSAVCVMVLLLSSVLVCACRATAQDPREEFVRSLGGANVEGYHFATKEDDVQAVASLTNSAVRDLIRFDGGVTNVVLRYTRETDKKTNTTRTYKTEALKTGAEVALVVTDIASGEVVARKPFPAPERHQRTDPTGKPADSGTFETLEDCINDFNCKRRGELQCEANRTCEDQFAALTCCLTNTQCFSVHLIIRPTTWRCRLRDIIVDVEGLVFTP